MIREIVKDDLDRLLRLYMQLHNNPMPEKTVELLQIKMMLLTGSKKESTLDFYRKAGYNSDDKTAFIQWI